MSTALKELEGWGETGCGNAESSGKIKNYSRSTCKCPESTRKHLAILQDIEEGKTRRHWIHSLLSAKHTALLGTHPCPRSGERLLALLQPYSSRGAAIQSPCSHMLV